MSSSDQVYGDEGSIMAYDSDVRQNSAVTS